MASIVSHGELVLTNHARDRMVERDIDMLNILDVLRLGDVSGEIEPGKGEDEWKCKVTGPSELDSGREIGVVLVVSKATRIIILTVEWEDI